MHFSIHSRIAAAIWSTEALLSGVSCRREGGEDGKDEGDEQDEQQQHEQQQQRDEGEDEAADNAYPR